MKTYLEVMGSYHVVLDKKEVGKLEKLSDKEGMMDREEFLEYARKSSVVKEFVERGAGGSGGKVSVGRAGKSVDKAELAFKVSLQP